MLNENQHPLNKSIVLSVLGVPNVGKSSLINAFLGTDLTIVTPKPQTTRNKINCVVVVDHTEIVFVDTPGLHRSNKEFNKRLNQQAVESLNGVDFNLIMIDLTREIMEQFKEIKDTIGEELGKTWVVFNKCDRVEDYHKLPLNEVIEKAKGIIPSIEKYFIVSAKSGDNMHILTGAICDVAPFSPHLYPDGEISNRNERFFATEYIREQAFQLLNEELPYEIAIVIDEYRDVDDDPTTQMKAFISASILVNRPSQRAIVIGSKGAMIKEIGTRARRKIEALIGGQVHLNLHVKVLPNWAKNNFILEEIGLPRAPTSARVWHKKDGE